MVFHRFNIYAIGRVCIGCRNYTKIELLEFLNSAIMHYFLCIIALDVGQ